MNKTTKTKVSSKPNNTKKKSINKSKKPVMKKVVNKNDRPKFGENKRNIYLTIFVIFMLAILLIVSSYAWFSTALNVKIRTFNMVVMRNDGLTISHDAVTYGS